MINEYKTNSKATSSPPIISLMLHDVTDAPLRSGFRQPTAQKYKHSSQLFLRYIGEVKESGLKVEATLPTNNGSPSVVFTFDDGGAAATHAADLLEMNDWRGFFFITTDLIGTPGFLTRRQIRELFDRGHVIGSHSCSHPDVFRALTAQQMRREWSESRDVLQQITGQSVTVASVPGGDIDNATIREASAAGLEHVFTSEQTTRCWQQFDTLCYGRLMMLDRTTPETLRRWLNFPRLGHLPERAVRMTKTGAKKALGPAYRKLVWYRRRQHDASTANTEDCSNESNDESSKDASHQAGSRVVALINPTRHCRSTCTELINAGVNLVGIVEAQTKTAGLPVKNFRRMVRKQGLIPTASQVAARVAYMATNRQRDRAVYDELFDQLAIRETLDEWGGPTISCETYSDIETLNAIKALKPDILVVHSQSWVDRRVREIPSTGLVIGGHPGITPHFRGSHSSFWALLNGQPEDIGWTTFHVDKGVDTGDIIIQGRLQVQPNDSYMTLNWQGMKKIARAQATAIIEFDRTQQIPRQPHDSIPENSEFGLPGLTDYLRYRRSQRLAR